MGYPRHQDHGAETCRSCAAQGERGASPPLANRTDRRLNRLGSLGASVLARARGVTLVVAMIAAASRNALRRRTWDRTHRRAIVDQVFEIGVGALGVVALLAVFAGLLVVLQARLWLARIGQAERVGPFLVEVLGAEITPLVVNLVLIVRSGAPMTAELAAMRLAGQVEALEAQGGDPFVRLVTPRILASGISVLPLAAFFLLGAHLSGWAATALMANEAVTLLQHFAQVAQRVPPSAPLSFALKCLAPALVTAAVCCHEAFTVHRVEDMAGAARRGVVRSLISLFVLSAVVSALDYM